MMVKVKKVRFLTITAKYCCHHALDSLDNSIDFFKICSLSWNLYALDLVYLL